MGLLPTGVVGCVVAGRKSTGGSLTLGGGDGKSAVLVPCPLACLSLGRGRMRMETRSLGCKIQPWGSMGSCSGVLGVGRDGV